MNRYGLIGEKLGHSFSKIIHERMADYTYELIPLAKDEMEPFIRAKNFAALNVTIPYKEAVMPLLDEIDSRARRIGAVNAVVNRNGKLYGYNTDYFGFRCQLEDHHVAVKGRKVLVLGKGGASKAVITALEDLEAGEIHIVYYKNAPGTISYEQCYAEHSDAKIIVNTTPVGMYPNIDQTPIDLSRFQQLEAVVDVVYNPLRTKLVLEAEEKGILGLAGLEMLVGQAKSAVEIFLDTKLDNAIIQKETDRLMLAQSNLIFTGMSGCGKTTVGRMLAERLNKKFVDTDALIVEKIGMSIADYFATYGEASFRKKESEIIASLAGENSLVISVGGGAVLDPKNVQLLKMNGRIFWIDRALELLESGKGRPLAPTPEAAAKLYAARLPVYAKTAEYHIENNGTAEEAVKKVADIYTSLVF